MFDYDAEADALVLKVRPGRPDHGEQDGNVITHYDRDGKVVEIELLDASAAAADLVNTLLYALRKRHPSKHSPSRS